MSPNALLVKMLEGMHKATDRNIICFISLSRKNIYWSSFALIEKCQISQSVFVILLLKLKKIILIDFHLEMINLGNLTVKRSITKSKYGSRCYPATIGKKKKGYKEEHIQITIILHLPSLNRHAHFPFSARPEFSKKQNKTPAMPQNQQSSFK